MEKVDFLDSLFNFIEDTKSSIGVTAIVDGKEIEFIPTKNSKFNLSLNCDGDNFVWAIDGYAYEPKHRKALRAIVDTHNESSDKKYHVNMLERYKKLVITGIEQTTEYYRAIEIIRNVSDFFTSANDFTKRVEQAIVDKHTRIAVVKERTAELRRRACVYESQGQHDKAMRCYKDICGKYYGWSHMEIIGLAYSHGRQTPYGQFPLNKEYQLECQMLAVKNASDNKFAPLLAYSLAKKLGKEALLKEIEKLGQKRGTWNIHLLRHSDNVQARATKIAEFYRNGIGCEQNEVCASYYDRLAKCERQEVFKDMLEQGFEPVFELMTVNDFYAIKSLSELESLSDTFRDRFLFWEDNGKLDLPDWFVPLVNGLNEVDRNLVLTKAIHKIEKDITALQEDVVTGKTEVLVPIDKDNGILLEANPFDIFIHKPMLHDLVDCQLSRQLKDIVDKLNNIQ
jgi:hypothetical protein